MKTPRTLPIVILALLVGGALVGALALARGTEDRIQGGGEQGGKAAADTDPAVSIGEGTVRILDGRCTPAETEIPLDEPLTFKNERDTPQEIDFRSGAVDDLTVPPKSSAVVRFPAGSGSFEFTCAGKTARVTLQRAGQ